MFIATLIAAKGQLADADLSTAQEKLAAAGCTVSASRWIDTGVAADLDFTGDPLAAREALEGRFDATDVIVQAAAHRRKRLLVADMDSTMITVECIDELADYAGIKQQVAEVTERAMRGELDFAAALDARVALLEGLDEAVIEQCLAERVTLMAGARTLVRTMKARGGHAILVSGGFTRFAEPVAAGAASLSRALVPQTAVVRDGDAAFVFVVKGDRVEQRTVRLGEASGSSFYVLEGLSGGERVVTSGAESLGDGDRIEIDGGDA